MFPVMIVVAGLLVGAVGVAAWPIVGRCRQRHGHNAYMESRKRNSRTELSKPRRQGRLGSVLLLAPKAKRGRMSPTSRAAMSVVGALVFLWYAPTLVGSVFPNKEKKQKLANDSVGAYLSVAGLLYALVLSQVFNQVSARFLAMEQYLSEEVGALHGAVLLLASLKTHDDQSRAFKAEIFTILQGCVLLMLRQLNEGELVDPDELGLLYSLVPILGAKLDKSDTVQVHIASRAIDSINDVSALRYKRAARERASLGTLFYCFNFLLCNSMFFGILLINTGSMPLNFTFCMICVTLIGATTFVIADLDDPHAGNYRIDVCPCEKLAREIIDLQQSDRIDAGLSLERDNAVALATTLKAEYKAPLQSPSLSHGALKANLVVPSARVHSDDSVVPVSSAGGQDE